MLNRRLLRVKVMQELYAWQQTGNAVSFHQKQLRDSVDRLYSVYLLILSLPVVLKPLLEGTEINKANRFVKLENDLLSGKNFIQNKVILDMESHEHFMFMIKKDKMRWDFYPDLLKIILAEIKETENYKTYCNTENPPYNFDKTFLINLFNDIKKSEKIDEQIEEIYPNWQEIKTPVYVAIIRSMHKIKKNEHDFLMSFAEMGDEENETEFAKQLLKITIERETELDELLSDYLKNWDLSRVAVIDRILLKMALCEMFYFHEIPPRVTINEYIEISKVYSTPESKNFINGVLDKILKEKIEKS